MEPLQRRRHAFHNGLERGIVPDLFESELARGQESGTQLRDFFQRRHGRARVPRFGLETREIEIERGIVWPLLEGFFDGGDASALLAERGGRREADRE